MRFKSRVTAIQFSPCAQLLAVALEWKNACQIWTTPLHGSHASPYDMPETSMVNEFSPFVLLRTMTGHHDRITHLQWSPDGQWLLSSSKDMTCRLFSREPMDGYKPLVMAAHRDKIVAAYFSQDQSLIYSVGHDGSCLIWSQSNDLQAEESGTGAPIYRLQDRHFFNQTSDHGPARIKSAAFHAKSCMLVVGYSTGVFSLYEVPDFTQIHCLSVSQRKIDAIAISPSGDWLAMGSEKLGQLLVWEWQSETYILKQQGHKHSLSCMAYSPDGQSIATGCDDGKVKLWNTHSGFCFVTFKDHSASVTCLEFIGKQSGKQGVLFTSSLDGTVRAFDLIRYRCFRTFTAPHPCQFVSLAVDPSGELVCAGTLDTYEIFVWSVQTGQLLDVFAGHEGPVVSLAFSPEGTVESSSSQSNSAILLISGSWDYTARVWDVYGRGVGRKCLELHRHKAEVTTMAFRPDGKEFAVATLDGMVTFWDPYEGSHPNRISEIDGLRDISGGRKTTDRRASKNNTSDKHFTTLCYTADGNGLMAAGNSKWVCMYNLPAQVLLKKFQICKNQTFDGLKDKLNSKRITDAGAVDLIDDPEDFSDLEDRLEARQTLPGVSRGDLSDRKVKPAIRCMSVRFHPMGRSWAAATTEGLVVYSMDDSFVFDPFDLDMELTPSAIQNLVREADQRGESAWLQALIMALRLNEPGLTQFVYEAIPVHHLPWIAKSLPEIYVAHMLLLLANLLETDQTPSRVQEQTTSTSWMAVSRNSPHIQFHLIFLDGLLRAHGRYLRTKCQNKIMRITASLTLKKALSLPVCMRALKKSLQGWNDDLSRMFEANRHMLSFLLQRGSQDIKPLQAPQPPTQDDPIDGAPAAEGMPDYAEPFDDLMLVSA